MLDLTKTVCRACLKEAKRNEEWNSLFSKVDGFAFSNYKTFIMLTGIEVDPFCTYAVHFCNTCEIKLLQSFKFLVLCKRSSKILQEHCESSLATNQNEYNWKHNDNLKISDKNSSQIIDTDFLKKNQESGQAHRQDSKEKQLNLEKNNKNNKISIQAKVEPFENLKNEIFKLEESISQENLDLSDNLRFLDKSKNVPLNVYESEDCIKHPSKENFNARFFDIPENDFEENASNKLSFQITKLQEELKNNLPKCSNLFPDSKAETINYLRSVPLNKKFKRKREKVNTTPLLQKIFASENSVKSEEIDEVQYICDICGNIYKKRNQLEFHRHLHTGVKNFKCEICDRRFAHKTYLSGHMLIHNGERKKYQCRFCEKEFSRPRTRKLHEKTHTLDYSHECKVCNKKFILKNYLVRHMRIHNDERPYHCKMCGVSFRRDHHLSQHFKTKAHKIFENIKS